VRRKRARKIHDRKERNNVYVCAIERQREREKERENKTKQIEKEKEIKRKITFKANDNL
jgi:hypothetical protein